jgi:hypothetical protein
VAELRQELALHDDIAGRAGVQYGPYSAAQRAQLRGQVLRFLQAEPQQPDEPQQLGADSIAPLQLLSARHMLEVLAMCREVLRGAGAGAAARAPDSRPPPAHHPAGSSTRTSGQQHGVGDVEGDNARQSGGVGVAPEECRPSGEGEVAGGEGAGSPCLSARGGGGSAGGFGSGVPAGRDAAWEEYRAGPGGALADALTQNRLKAAQVGDAPGGGRRAAGWLAGWLAGCRARA